MTYREDIEAIEKLDLDIHEMLNACASQKLTAVYLQQRRAEHAALAEKMNEDANG